MEPADAVELKYFSSTEQKFIPLTCDEHLGLLFSLNVERRFGKIHIDTTRKKAISGAPHIAISGALWVRHY